MSKKRERMESFREAVKRKRPEKPEGTERASNDRMGVNKIVVTFAAAIAVFAGVPMWNNRKERLDAIEYRVEKWGSELALLYTEVETLKRIEISYHGGNILGGPTRKTDKERADHNEELIKSVREEVAPLLMGKLRYKPD